jgi:hypothetical protein
MNLINKIIMNQFRFIISALAISISAVTIYSCTNNWSKIEEDKSVGLNGSFEIVKNGLPVNWWFSTPEEYKNGDIDIIIDSSDFKDGKQSLKFHVKNCSGLRGNKAPGFFQEFREFVSGETYLISFWIKNHNSEFEISARGVEATTGEDGHIIKSNDSFTDWKYYEFEYKIPEKKWLRIEMSILKPGDFWIDDLRIIKKNKN